MTSSLPATACNKTQRCCVSRSGSAWVEPAKTLEPQLVKLTPIENLCAHVYPSATVFLRIEQDQDILQRFEHLRQGLSRMLYEIPILTGTLEQDARGAFSVRIPKAPDAGARFHFLDLSGDDSFPTFEEIAQRGFPFANGSSDGLERLVVNDYPASEAGDPVSLWQLVHLKGGLMVVGSFTHMVGELILAHEYLHRWAKHSYDAAAAAHNGKPMPALAQYPADTMDRTRLSPGDGKDIASPDEMKTRGSSFENLKPINSDDLEGTMAELQNMMPKAHVLPHEMHRQDDLRKTTMGIWRFSLAQQKSLQKAAQETAPKDAKVSSVDALTAFLWQRFVVAKYTNALPTESSLVYAGNIRRRLNPPLPPNYLGAAVDLFRVKLPASRLVARQGQSPNQLLGDAAVMIRDSNSKWSEEQYMTLLELSQRAPMAPGFVPRGPIDVLATDHSRIGGILTTEWGPGLSKPVSFREPYLGRDCPAGEITIMPRWPNGDLEVMISGEVVTIERLCVDEQMKRMSAKVFITHDVLAETRRSGALRARL